jgi:hypothetical protein
VITRIAEDVVKFSGMSGDSVQQGGMTHVGHVTVDVTASGAHGAFVRQCARKEHGGCLGAA